jgi:hypothetical protein
MIMISKLISKHRKPAVVLYRVLVALSVLAFALSYAGVLLNRQFVPWPVEWAALAVLISCESLASRFLLS